MASKTFNVGIIGYGMSAKIFHIPFIKLEPKFNLYSIVQRSPKDGNSAPADYPALKHYTDAKDLIADPNVDLIVVTTPPDSHFNLTKSALESGKHVLTEKPFVPTSAEARKLAEIAKQSNRLLCVYQNRRWDSDFLLAKHLIQNQTLGRIVELDSHFDRYRAEGPKNTWKAELGADAAGSVVYDLGTHLFDQVYVLFGKPTSVYGKLLSQRTGTATELQNPDAVSAQLAYPNGLIVNVRISSLSAEAPQRRFWVRGTKGSLHTYGLDFQEDQLKAGKTPDQEGFGKLDPELSKLTLVQEDGKFKSQGVPDLKPETYTAFYKGLADAIESGKEEDVPVKPTQAADVLRIIEALRESAETGNSVKV